MTSIYLRVCAAMLAAPLAYAQSASVPVGPVASHTTIEPRYGSTPLSFEPNHGQTDAAVQFLARGNGYITFLQPDSATLLLSHPQERSDVSRVGRQAAPQSQEVLRMKLVGGAPDAPMHGESQLPGYVNYLRGGRSTSSVGLPTFAATAVQDVYPGIDLVYYGTNRRLEYDFVVAPHADPRRIRLAIDGAHPMLESNGELRLRVGKTVRATDVVFHKPSVYQVVAGRRHMVNSAFQIDARGDVGFKLGTYDRGEKLVIDPVVSYASYFGGSGEDEINGSALNASNQLYAVGQTHSSELPGATGEFQSARMAGKNSNYHDAFVTKFSADGSTIIWTTYLAGSQDDFATAVAVNSADQAYVVGYTNSCGLPSSSPSFPFTSDAIQTLCSPAVLGFNNYESNGVSYDAFLVKLSADGKTLLYGTPLGGGNNDVASGVALDPTGKVYIVGQTTSTQYFYAVSSNLSDVPSYPVNNHGQASIGTSNYPTTPNAFYSNTTESKQYATTDGSGNVGGPTDEQAFLTVLSADLHTMVYSTLIGGGILGGCGNGACNTNGLAIAVNAGGIAYIGGNTSSAHWPTTSGSFAPTCANAGTATSQCPMTGWLAAFDPTKTGNASLLFSTYVNGSSAGTNGGNPLYPSSDVYGLAIDSKGNVVATGDTNANNFPTTPGTLQPACVLSSDGNNDVNVCANAFVTKFSSTGATLWSTYYHGTAAFSAGAAVIGYGVALDTSDNVYVVGTSNVPSIPLLNPAATNSTSQVDVFLFELTADAKTLLAGTFLGSGGGVSLDSNSLHLDGNRNAYFSGSQAPNPYGGTTFPVTANAFDTAIQGSDGWVVKMTTSLQTASTALVVSPSAVAPGASVTFTATVTGVAGAAVPTGTVSFNNGGAVLGTGVVNGLGVATLTTKTLGAGSYSVVAVYSGDSLYSTNSSTAQPLTVTVPAAAPTVTLAAAPVAITLGKTSTLTWSSSNATVCTASNGWSGSEAINGTAVETPAAVGSVSYVLSCTGPGGTVSATADVTVSAAPAAPKVTLTAAPTAITLGQTSTLTWSSSNATACTASNGWSGAESTSGTAAQTPGAAGTVSYVLSCTGAGGSVSATANVTVSAAPTVASTGTHGGGGALDWWSLGGLFAFCAAGAGRRRSR